MHPNLQEILIDLPKTIEQGKILVKENGMLDRIKFFGQSCFETLFQGYDVYLVRKVIDDWPDAEVKKCYKIIKTN